MEKPNLEKYFVPLNPYDLLGYLLPGGTFFICVFLFETWINNLSNSFFMIKNAYHTPIYTLLKSLTSINEKNWLSLILILFSLTLFTYIIAHIIASLSSLFIDRILIQKGYGYPYERILEIKDEIDKNNKSSRSFYRGFFFWINFLIILSYVIFIFPQILFMKLNLLKVLFYIFFVIFIITIVLKIILFAKTHEQNKKSRIKIKLDKIFNFFLKTYFSGIYDTLTSLLGKYLNTRRAFNPEMIKEYNRCFKNKFKLDPQKSETNNFWFSFLYVIKNSNSCAQMVDNWQRLYSFARNLSTSFYLAFFYCTISLLLQRNVFISGRFYEFFILVSIPLIYFIFSLILLYRYYYLYFAYYTKFVFRSFVFQCISEAREDK